MKIWQELGFWLQVVIIITSYIALALGYIPGLRLNRATIALITTAFLIASGSLTLAQAWSAIDPNTIIFLLSMMIINGYLAYSGFFSLCLWYLQQFTLNPFSLIVNPQNILVGSFSGISYLEFTKTLILPSILGLMGQTGVLWLLYPEIRSLKPINSPDKPTYRIYLPLLKKTLIITAILLISFVIGFPLTESAFFASAILLITRRIKPNKILAQIDWSLLVMFSGLFVLTRCVQYLNLFSFVADWINNSFNLVVITMILSNLISNVPAVLLLQGLIHEPTTKQWLLLASSATLAGNLTLFGSVANLIMVENAAKKGYKLSFGEHLRFGLPLTIITTLIVYYWI